MGNGILSRAGSGDGYRVGDIVLSSKNSLGEKWALCNGDPITGGGIDDSLVNKLGNPLNSGSWQMANYSNQYNRILYDKVNDIHYGVVLTRSGHEYTLLYDFDIYKLSPSSETLVFSRHYTSSTFESEFGSSAMNISDIGYSDYTGGLIIFGYNTDTSQVFISTINIDNNSISLYKTLDIAEIGANFYYYEISSDAGLINIEAVSTPYPVFTYDNNNRPFVWIFNQYILYIGIDHIIGRHLDLVICDIKNGTTKCLKNYYCDIGYLINNDGEIGEEYSYDTNLNKSVFIAEEGADYIVLYEAILTEYTDYVNESNYSYEAYINIIAIQKSEELTYVEDEIYTDMVTENCINFSPCISCYNYDDNIFYISYKCSYDDILVYHPTLYPGDILNSALTGVSVAEKCTRIDVSNWWSSSSKLFVNIITINNILYGLIMMENGCYIKELTADTVNSLIQSSLTDVIRLINISPINMALYGGRNYPQQSSIYLLSYDADSEMNLIYNGAVICSSCLPTVNKDGINGFIKIKN